MDEGFCTRPCGQCILEGVAVRIEITGIMLGQAAGHQAPQEIANDQAAHPAGRLLKCDHPSKADGRSNGAGYGGVGQSEADTLESFCGNGIVKEDFGDLGCETTGAGCCALPGFGNVVQDELGWELHW